MRVLVVDHTAREGGAELALARLVEQIHSPRIDVRAVVFEDGPLVDRLRAAGTRTVVLALDETVARTSRDRLLSPVALVRSVAQAIRFVPRLARAIRGSGAELVVANSLKSAVFTALAAPLARRPWVWHLHDRLAPDYLPRPLVAGMRALAAAGPRALVVNSLATMDTLPPRARAKASVAYPGLAATAFEPAAPTPEAPVVGIVGRISPTKGQREFLEAAAIVLRGGEDVRFRVVGASLFGEEDYEADMHRLPESLGIADRVEFTGWVADPGSQLRALSVFVHASPVPEPFGQVVAEAMAAGVPVVAADAGGIRELLDPEPRESHDEASAVRETRLGVLVRPGDPGALARAIAMTMADDVARARRAAAAVEAARDLFTIERTAATVEATWSAAVSNGA
ncbi:glycosyltransferase family 4 protein [Microbacterium aoyamense]|uniref:D-inositol 3-phosphate glycosyltransferase n=1 Tax=Microbacterium aoyamense TaxID=344166 RepID=A0ABP5AR87_9MICO|nr:glycosyltransferase [Microbacterium aoyamense]